MILSFHTGFQKGRSIVLEPWDIALQYCRTWFILDLFIVGSDWSLVAVGDSDSGGSAARLGRSLRTMRFVRTLRLIRMAKMKRLLQEVQDRINSEATSICFGIIKIITSLVLANHIVACIWYFIGVDAQSKSSWVAENQLQGETIFYRYVTSLHWSLTQFTPASMEITPTNTGERTFAVVVLLFAMVAFSSFVSILTASMAELRKISDDETRQFWLLRRYLRDWGVGRRTGRRIQKFLEYAYRKQRQRVQESDVGLLALLSEPLRVELKHETYSAVLVAHPFFCHCRERAKDLGRALRDMALAHGDVIFHCGEAAKRMIFVSSGAMDYVMGDEGDDGDEMTCPQAPCVGKVVVALPYCEVETEVVIEGEWVCEAALWTTWLHQGDLQARVDCQVITVDAQLFAEAVKHHTPMFMKVRKYAMKFVAQLNKVCRDDLTDLVHKIMSAQEIIDSLQEFAMVHHRIDDEEDDELMPWQLMRRGFTNMSERFVSWSKG